MTRIFIPTRGKYKIGFIRRRSDFRQWRRLPSFSLRNQSFEDLEIFRALPFRRIALVAGFPIFVSQRHGEEGWVRAVAIVVILSGGKMSAADGSVCHFARHLRAGADVSLWCAWGWVWGCIGAMLSVRGVIIFALKRHLLFLDGKSTSKFCCSVHGRGRGDGGLFSAVRSRGLLLI